MSRIPVLLTLTAVLVIDGPARATGDLVTEWPAPPGGPGTTAGAPPLAAEPAADRSITPTPPLPPPPTAIIPGASPRPSGPDAEPTLAHQIEALPAPPRFGTAGTFVFDGNLWANFGYLGYSVGSSSSTTFGIQPSFDYFSSDGFSEGVSIFGRYSSATSGIDITSHTISYGATVHLGPHFWLGERVSLWPRFFVGAWQSRTSYSGGFGGEISVDGTATPVGLGIDLTENALYVELFAPVLFHPAPHFFVGIGPDAFTDLVHSAGGASNRRRSIAVSSTVGGWF